MFFDDSRKDRRQRANKRDGVRQHVNITTSLVPPAKAYELLTVDELFNGTPRTFIADTECYVNYWLCAFKCVDSGKIIYFEESPDASLNANLLAFILARFVIVGFNWLNYDAPMCALAMSGVPTWKLKEVSDEIIKEGKRPYQVCKDYGVKLIESNVIDLIDVAPLDASLKIYSGRIHCERMQDLPYPEDHLLKKHEAFHVRDYCINDLDNTELLWLKLKPHLELREILGKEYGVDLRSKSDAQVAENIISIELDKLGIKGKKPTIEAGDSFYYEIPDYISFKTPQFQRCLDVLRETPFYVGNSGSAECPEAIDKLMPRLGGNVYKLGVGGLHSQEKGVFYQTDKDTLIIDRDVASYYPYIILNNRLFPPHLGEAFLEVYRSIVLRRLKLKKEKNPLEAGLKIAINGIFGKLGNFYSKVYAPNLLLQVCMTGQLCLMMFIEAIELAGIPVLSANTDGIVIKCPKARYNDLMTIVMQWENKTGFSTEETRYEKIGSRDVNNYITCKTDFHIEQGDIVWHDGVIKGTKTKGAFSTKGSAQNSELSKNPESYVSSMAVQEFLSNGTPIADTVINCKTLGHFLSVRTVKGGAYKDGIFLGKAVRWYYAVGETGTINYVLSGNKVPKSEGAKPLMILPTAYPNDIDYDYYINEANEMLYDIGYYKRLAAPSLF